MYDGAKKHGTGNSMLPRVRCGSVQCGVCSQGRKQDPSQEDMKLLQLVLEYASNRVKNDISKHTFLSEAIESQ